MLPEKNKDIKVCPVCQRVANEPVVCPNCGKANICSYHLFTFQDSEGNQIQGCSNCGPRCSRCNSQSTLTYIGEKPYCSTCIGLIRTIERMKEEERVKKVNNITSIVSAIIPLIGGLIGLIVGTYPDMRKILLDIFHTTDFPNFAIIMIWGALGFIGASIATSIVNYIIAASGEAHE